MARRGASPSVVLGALLFIMMMSAIGESAGFVIFFLIGLLILSRFLNNSNMKVNFGGQTAEEEEEDYERDWQASRQARPAQSEPVYRHALDAVSRAGHDPETVQVLAVDLGVLGFRGSEPPTVYRTWSLPDDLDYIQPFVQLRVPMKANGRVRFELLDADGEPVFVHEEIHSLVRGRNFISPGARLPIHDQRGMDGKWRLRISADNVLLAVHEFQFAEAENVEIHHHIGEDGEITSELKAVMTGSQLPSMSLDDLLAFQEQEEAARRAAQ